MKTYIITEKDLERLQETYSNGGDSWWYNSRMDEWVKTLEPILTKEDEIQRNMVRQISAKN